MADRVFTQNNFQVGIVGSAFSGSAITGYNSAALDIENFHLTTEGHLVARPGTRSLGRIVQGRRTNATLAAPRVAPRGDTSDPVFLTVWDDNDGRGPLIAPINAFTDAAAPSPSSRLSDIMGLQRNGRATAWLEDIAPRSLTAFSGLVFMYGSSRLDTGVMIPPSPAFAVFRSRRGVLTDVTDPVPFHPETPERVYTVPDAMPYVYPEFVTESADEDRYNVLYILTVVLYSGIEYVHDIVPVYNTRSPMHENGALRLVFSYAEPFASEVAFTRVYRSNFVPATTGVINAHTPVGYIGEARFSLFRDVNFLPDFGMPPPIIYSPFCIDTLRRATASSNAPTVPLYQTSAVFPDAEPADGFVPTTRGSIAELFSVLGSGRSRGYIVFPGIDAYTPGEAPGSVGPLGRLNQENALAIFGSGFSGRTSDTIEFDYLAEGPLEGIANGVRYNIDNLTVSVHNSFNLQYDSQRMSPNFYSPGEILGDDFSPPGFANPVYEQDRLTITLDSDQATLRNDEGIWKIDVTITITVDPPIQRRFISVGVYFETEGPGGVRVVGFTGRDTYTFTATADLAAEPGVSFPPSCPYDVTRARKIRIFAQYSVGAPEEVQDAGGQLGVDNWYLIQSKWLTITVSDRDGSFDNPIELRDPTITLFVSPTDIDRIHNFLPPGMTERSHSSFSFAATISYPGSNEPPEIISIDNDCGFGTRLGITVWSVGDQLGMTQASRLSGDVHEDFIYFIGRDGETPADTIVSMFGTYILDNRIHATNVVPVRIGSPSENVVTVTASGTTSHSIDFSTSLDPFNGVPAWPRCMAPFQQRIIYGGGGGGPLQDSTLFASAVNTLSCFNRSNLPADSWELSIGIDPSDYIHSLVPFRDKLLIFTLFGIWSLEAMGGGGVTTANARIEQQSDSGSVPHLEPLIVQDEVYYISHATGRLHKLVYGTQGGRFTGVDVSSANDDLFASAPVTSWALKEGDPTLIYAVQDNGEILVILPRAGSALPAFTRYTTNGRYHDVAVGPSGVFYVIDRAVGGEPPDYHLEIEDDQRLDGALAISPGATHTLTIEDRVVSGLDTFMGQTVRVIVGADNLGDFEVSPSGQITLPRPLDTSEEPMLRVGLPYRAQILTLPPVSQTGSTQADSGPLDPLLVKLRSASLRQLDSAGVVIQDMTGRHTLRARERTDEPYGFPTRLRSTIRTFKGPIDVKQGIRIVHEESRPTTVQGYVLDLDVGDTP